MKKILPKVFFIMIALFGQFTDLLADEVVFRIEAQYMQEGSQYGSPYGMIADNGIVIHDTKFSPTGNYIAFYKGGTTTITPATGTTITKIVFNIYDSGFNGYQNGGSLSPSLGTVSKTADKIVEWKGSATESFTIAHTQSIRWTTIVVTYENQGVILPDATIHTASFSINDFVNEANDVQVAEGSLITFPSVPSVHGYSFKGWSKVSINGTQATAPELINTNEERMGQSDVVYYAVFATFDNGIPEKLGSQSVLKDGDRIAAFIEFGSKYYGMYHQASTDAFIDNYVLDTNPALSNLAADTRNTWTITSAENSTWYIGDENLGYLYNENESDELSLSYVPQTSFSIEWNDGYFVIKNGSRWLSCRIDLTSENRFKFQGGGKSLSKVNGNAQFLLYRLIGDYSNYCTTLPSSSLTFVAKDSHSYYSTFCNENAVSFPLMLVDGVRLYVEVVKVSDGRISKNDIAKVFMCEKDGRVVVPAKTGVLLHVDGAQEAPTVPFSIYLGDAVGDMVGLHSSNMLIPCFTTGGCPEREGSYRYYKLAYGDNGTKTGLGFWWGAEDGGNGFAVKGGGAVLCVPTGSCSNMRGFGFEDEGTLTVVGCRADVVDSGVVYNWNGQRVGGDSRGCLIVGGRKVVR